MQGGGPERMSLELLEGKGGLARDRRGFSGINLHLSHPPPQNPLNQIKNHV